MALSVEDLNDQSKFRQILIIPYEELIQFVFGYLKKKSPLIIFFWLICAIFMILTVFIRINIAGLYLRSSVIYHTLLGLVILPVICIPVHELLHIVPYYLTGARNIRVGMDLRQFFFYVTAHRYVASSFQFRVVALMPFVIISILCIFLIVIVPGLWKWSLSSFLFVHTTMCAGDFALLNFYFLNREKNIYTWDDADMKTAYFYEKL